MSAPLLVIGAEDVERLLGYEDCIALMRKAMKALARGETRQPLRNIIDLQAGNAFGVMPGAMLGGTFGAKIVSVYPGNFALGKHSHQGIVVLFEPESGAPVAIIDGSIVTAIRTAAASAAATEALARPGPSRLAILGYGEQAWRHAAAIRHVRPITGVSVWGRSAEQAEQFSLRVREELGLDAEAAPDVARAVRGADIICTTTPAAEPILALADVQPGAHINSVGSSRAGPAEIANDLVAASRFIADYRVGVLAQGAEFLNAKSAGLVDDAHIVGEIGEVFDGTLAGRTGDAEITIYKSLGHIVQDLAAGWHVFEQARAKGLGTTAPF
ncbi:ornithine cyclodeaminase family protein [Sphingosinicella soli]|uniref:Ornithine cyclodeaminase n=1 Tax=Sphingosinicella soli TaxID=333708 RepID=A0A7W7AZ04_9SPHN|nr:ornithine cyclodeaminase family protein [Sphingosinicella soli]MBB4630970.1 ornithine cyclodeaminase [Sphingosinicella soli]